VTLHPDVMSQSQRELLRRLGPVASKEGFYLGGGTSLALQLGHRRSLDLDWFGEKPMGDPLLLANRIRDAGTVLVVEAVDEGTLHADAVGTRVSFFEYRYPLLRPLVRWEEYGCMLASLEDLACMKLAAIAGRGDKRDFVDVDALAGRDMEFAEMLDLYRQKFEVRDIGHLLFSLTYFDDADQTSLPEMLHDVDWAQVKRRLQDQVRAFVQRGKSPE